MKKFFSLSFALLFSSITHSDFESRIENIKERIEDTKCHVRYYTPYALAATIGTGSCAANSKFGLVVLTGMGVYSLYATYRGYKVIKAIEKKYKVHTKVADYWNNFYEDEKFLFCRWRQQDDRFGDGYYWPTAWLCDEDRKEVRKKFIQDIHAQRIEIITNGKKIKRPKPSHIISLINQELNDLEMDKKQLKAYTNVYRAVKQPEAFHPDTSFCRLLWPNYNRASKLYIELVQMMKRLEVVRDIIAEIRSEVSGDRWPKA